MKYLVDTCVWIEHCRVGIPELITLLKERRALTHSCVIGELSCGILPNRITTLEDLLLLPKAQEASFTETLQFIEKKKLFGKSLGWVDFQLLVSAKLSDARIFTFDKKLKRFS